MTRLTKRCALLIGTEHYDDGGFHPLPCTRADVWGMRQVLQHRSIGGFGLIQTETDLTADDMQQAISEFLSDRKPDELALVYISGHGKRDDGEFRFVAKDTEYARTAETGVSAGYVNERLEECVAPQKIVMIDCCRSGGFAIGLRTSHRNTSEPIAKSGESAPLTSRGVYVLSSSRAGELSFGGTVTETEVQPSVFTTEVIEALRTGKVSKDSGGSVTVSDLFHYVNRRMRAQGANQIPVHSALGVDDRIVIADSPLGSAPVLVPVSGRPAPPRTTGPAPAATPKSGDSQPTWTDLLDYYRDCVLSDDTETPLLEVRVDSPSYACLSGAERLLTGEVEDDGCVAVPPEADSLVQSATAQNAELWAGYPAVVLTGPRGRRPWRHPRFAPLLIRRVEIVREDGAARLKPYGPVQPHPQLARDWLGDEEAAQLAETYQPTWHRGQHERMAVDVGNLLTQEFELPCVQELRPDELAGPIDIHTPGHGARNTAVLFTALPETAFTKQLLKDFADIAKMTERIPETALAALAPDASERGHAHALADPAPGSVVTPLSCNEAQAEVLRSALTRRLTVATGPPGTGKSQLVANLVASAVAAGQTVLVASTNNDAVDEVWRRCESLVPGSVVRTGSSNYAEQEAGALHTLRTMSAAASNVTTAAMDLGIASDRLARVRVDHARAAGTERALREAGAAREQSAEQLGQSVAGLLDLLDSATRRGRLRRPAKPGRLAGTARKLAHRHFLGQWSRNRFLRRTGLGAYEGDTVDGCLALAEFLAARETWDRLHPQAAGVDDVVLTTALRDAESAVRSASGRLLDSSVRTHARNGRQRILALLRARDDGRTSDWSALRDVLGRAHGRKEAPAVAGWAVTSLSARRFPRDPALFDLVVIDEASQCAIPHVVPLLFRARRALVIGDAMQLTHIVKTGPEHEALIRRRTGLRADWLEKHRLAYRRHSAFHAAERSAGGTLLLDEHFRCHPDIAAVSNELFYDGELTVLTDTRVRPSLNRPALIWSHVPGKAGRPRHGSSWVNDDEIRKVNASVRYLLEQLPDEATIGIVTPFKAQADALREQLGHYDQERLRVGTVHTFQGGERDVMVFSLVAADGMHPGAVSWVSRQVNLWNVAITRARTHLIVVGDRERWSRQEGTASALLEAATAGAPRSGAADGDELTKRLYQRLAGDPSTTVVLGENVAGHPVDALLKDADGAARGAVLLDHGVGEHGDAARHLRLMLHRRTLLDDGPRGLAATRCPAWRLYDTGPADDL
ncbi:AAA domain-containing protein [Streptomyces sp. Z26]|uniref:caspase, EACC1-associated type n=1 Tax=Streptomyces sp. Z26 TaxID=2500177 RepID=UPI000EF17475|nr:AAA domain-containing protein [Streptomyces sp. Z26]RLL65991.1 hypothetical protein D7M15_02735 [Streptomyces sp. Z26]